MQFEPEEKEIKISVTQEHIDNGIAHSSSACPIALAFEDADLHDASVMHDNVYYYEIYFYDEEDEKEATIDQGIQDWREKYDTGQHVDPIELVLVKSGDGVWTPHELLLA